ncbi:hypothetical protein Clacol_000394 [Clathrus columnatus]|uniref:N-acetyltransferase domain-containing protein n=1 Tax=Clathrus columnatus TaxID=1419009 RepID=A0AAV5A2U5_9AGAM|nr:hypothetical protein Clacol_000394 [Clathrus columnatus]
MLGAALMPQPTVSRTVRGMSWNLRYDSMPDNITIPESIAALNGNDIQTPTAYYPDTNERPWSQRRIPVSNTVNFAGVSILGFEEAVVRQVNDMQTLLGDEWDHRGLGRADGTDDNASGAYDNEFGPSLKPCYSTTAQLRLRESSEIITAMVTHWDDQSDEAREIGASLILHRANYEALTTMRPVVLFGDFNSPAVNLTTPNCNSCTDGAYLIITGASPPLAINQTFADKFPVPANSPKFNMVDLKTAAPKEAISGNFATYTGFDSIGDYNDMKRIDFIMAGSNGGWDVGPYKIANNVFDDGLYMSDHRPVFADITFKEEINEYSRSLTGKTPNKSSEFQRHQLLPGSESHRHIRVVPSLKLELMPYIRPVKASDDPALSRICLLTGAAGKSAEFAHSLSELYGLIFALPYNKKFDDITFGFVLVDSPDESESSSDSTEGEVVGYILGTTDSVALREIEAKEWWPSLREKYPLATVTPGSYPERTEADNRLIEVIHSPYIDPLEIIEPYPAHIHIDILPSHQRKGYGHKLMASAVDYLRSKGHTGLFVGLDPRNDEAKKFYARIGFQRINREGGEWWSLDFETFK